MTLLFLHSHLALVSTSLYIMRKHTQHSIKNPPGKAGDFLYFIIFLPSLFSLFSDGLVKISQIITMHVETLLKYLHQRYEILTDSKVTEVQNKVYRIIFSEQSIFSPYSIIQKLIKFVKYQTPLSFIILHFSCLYFFPVLQFIYIPILEVKGKTKEEKCKSVDWKEVRKLNCDARSIMDHLMYQCGVATISLSSPDLDT